MEIDIATSMETEYQHIKKDDSVFDKVVNQVKSCVEDFDSSLLIKYLNEEHKTKKDYSGREIFELLQNAEDQNSDYVKITLDQDKICVENGGPKCVPFSRKGFISIMMADKSPKFEDGQKAFIGSKGLGFRSILNWADSVEISSNEVTCEFSREIADDIWPEIRESIKVNALKKGEDADKVIMEHEKFAKEKYGYSTPVPTLMKPKTFNYEGGLNKTEIGIKYCQGDKIVKDSILTQLERLNGNVLLFLKNISKIEIDNKLDNNVRTYVREEPKPIANRPNGTIYEYTIILQGGELNSESEKYYVFIDKDKELNSSKYEIGLAFCIDKEVSGEFLYTFFPTNMRISLPCIVHATFDLDSNRKALTENSRDNKHLMSILGKDLINFASWIASVRQKADKIDWRAMNLLLLKEKSLYPELVGAIQSNIRDIEIIPTYGKKYITLNSVEYFGRSVSEYISDFYNIIPEAPSCFKNVPIDGIPEEVLLELKKSETNNDFEQSINTISSYIVGRHDELELRTRLIRTLIKENIRGTFNILTDQEGSICNDVVYLYTGRTLPNPPKGLELALLNDSLKEELAEIYGKEPENLRKALEPVARIRRSDITAFQKNIINFTKENTDLDEFKVLVKSFFRGIYCVNNDNDKIEDIARKISSEIMLPDSTGIGKHLPCEMVLCDSSEKFAGFKDEWKMYMTLADWSDYLEADPETVRDFFYNTLNVSVSVPKTLVSFGQNEDYLKENFRDYHKYTKDRFSSGYFRNYVDDLKDANYSYVVKSEFLDYLKQIELDGKMMFETIFSDPGCRKSLSDKTIRYFYNSLHHEMATCRSFFEYNLAKSGVFDNLRFYIVSEAQNFAYPEYSKFNIIPGLSERETQQVLINLGAREKFNDLSKEELYELLLLIPKTCSSRGISSIYKKIREALLPYKDDCNEAVENFRLNGEVYAKQDGQVKLFPVSQTYYWDNGQLPKKILESKPKLEIGNRVGEDSVQKLFGVKLAKELGIEEIEGAVEENENLTNRFRTYFKDRVKYILSYCYSEQEQFKENYIDPLKKVEFRFYSRYKYRIDEESFELEEGEMITSPERDHVYKICSKSDFILNDSIDNPKICEAIVESICISLKITGIEQVNTIRNIISNSVSRNEFLWNKDIDYSIWETIQKAMGMSDSERKAWESISTQTGVQIELGKLAFGYKDKLEYLGQQFPGIDLHSIFPKTFPEFADMSPESLYAIITELNKKGVHDISAICERGLEDYYKNRLFSIKINFSDHYKKKQYDEALSKIEENHEPEIAYEYLLKCQKFRNSTEMTDTIANENRMQILSDACLVALVKKGLMQLYGVNCDKPVSEILPKETYYKILSEHSITEGMIDQKLHALMSFDGFEQVFKDEVAKCRQQSNNDAEEANSTTVYKKVIGKYNYGTGVPIDINSNKQISDKIKKSGGGSYDSRPANLYKNGRNAEWLVYNTLDADKTNFTQVLKNSRILDSTSCLDDSDKHCDILYYKSDAPLVERYLEVKSLKGESIFLSDDEYAFAQAHKDYYDIAVVENSESFTILEAPFAKDSSLMPKADVYRIDLEIKRSDNVM